MAIIYIVTKSLVIGLLMLISNDNVDLIKNRLTDEFFGEYLKF